MRVTEAQQVGWRDNYRSFPPAPSRPSSPPGRSIPVHDTPGWFWASWSSVSPDPPAGWRKSRSHTRRWLQRTEPGWTTWRNTGAKRRVSTTFSLRRSQYSIMRHWRFFISRNRPTNFFWSSWESFPSYYIIIRRRNSSRRASEGQCCCARLTDAVFIYKHLLSLMIHSTNYDSDVLIDIPGEWWCFCAGELCCL